MRFGLSIPNAGDPAELVDLAVAAEQAGWDGFFLWDHVQLDSKTRPPMQDPWVLLGAMAVRTSTMLLGTMVTPVPRRRPWKLAREINTLDHLSGGRVVVGVGLGVPAEDEYAAFGEPAQARTHAAILDEAMPVLDAFLRGERVDHDGEHFHVHAHLNPGALQRPRPPIWVAAMLPRKRGVARASRWDGIFALHADTGPLTAPMVADLVAEMKPREGYDIVTMLGSGNRVDELADAGATWVLDGPSDPHESFAEVRRTVEAGPPTI